MSGEGDGICHMTWDPTWEAVHRAREWCPSCLMDLPPFVVMCVAGRKDAKGLRALDIGCGGGASTLFLAQVGYEVHAIDGSASAARLTARRLAERELPGFTYAMDAIEIAATFPPEHFDLILDVSAIQHNRWEAELSIARQAETVLKTGGWLYSRMAAAGAFGDGTGVELEPRTYTDVDVGPAKEMGTIRFNTRDDVLALWGWLDLFGHVQLDNRMDVLRQSWWLEWVVQGRKRVEDREGER